MKFQDLEKSPAYQLWLASNAWQRSMRRALEPLNLTHVQFVLLASIDLLSNEHGCVTQAQVSRFAAIDENMTSQVMRTLASRGLLMRIEHPSDCRAKQLVLTDEGKDLVAEARKLIIPVRERFFEPVAERAEELAALLRLVVEA